MHKDTVVVPLDPFTSEEEAELVAKLELLPVLSLERYIGSAKNSLGNQALAMTWRPRIEFALRHAELALAKARATAAAAEATAAQVVETPAPAPKRKKAAAAA